MSPPIVERHASFSAATRRAKVIAAGLGCVTVVLRVEDGWLVRAAGSHEVSEEAEDESQLSDGSFTAYDDEYEREVRQPLVQEMNDYQDAWARSEEDGWFYED